jgi:hypothetical protein
MSLSQNKRAESQPCRSKGNTKGSRLFCMAKKYVSKCANATSYLGFVAQILNLFSVGFKEFGFGN